MSIDRSNPEEYVRENRERVVAVIRNSDDAFTRACAWALLDRHTPEKDLEDLKDELEAIASGGERQ